MKIRTLLIILIVSILPSLLLTPQTGTCPNVHTDGDELIWNSFVHSDEYKEWFTDFYKIGEGDWDEGWGWASLDYTREFPKMWSAVHALGLIDHTRSGRWDIDLLVDSDNISGMPDLEGRPGLMVDASRRVHVFARSAGDSLYHYTYDSGIPRADVSLEYENLSLVSTSPDSRPLLFNGDPAIVSGIGEPLQVVGLSAGTPGNIVLFEQTSASLTGNWTAEVLTSSAPNNPFQLVSSAALKDAQGTIHVIGVNSSGVLVHYLGRSGMQLVLYNEQELRASTSPRSIAATVDGERIDVFVVGRYGPDLLHYWYTPGSSWEAENVSEDLDDEFHLATDSHLAVLRRGPERFTVFGRTQAGDVIRFGMKKDCICLGALGCISCTDTWDARNLTRDAALVSNPPNGVSWNVSTIITDGPYAYLSPDGSEHVFGLGYGVFSDVSDFLKYYWQSPDRSWNKMDATLELSRGNASLLNRMKLTAPPVLVDAGDGVRLYAVAPDERLVQYHCARVDGTPTVSFPGNEATFTQYNLMAATPAAVVSPLGEVNVFTVHRNASWLIHHKLLSDRAWHASADYQIACSGDLYSFHYEPKNQTSDDTAALYSCWTILVYTSKHIEMWCGSFDANTDAGQRAGIMVHEATHDHNANWVCGGNSHDENNQDEFFLHGLLAYIPGLMFLGHVHSSFQLEIEFLADLSQFPTEGVPLEIRSSARGSANRIMRNRISNDVPWNVGIPRPL